MPSISVSRESETRVKADITVNPEEIKPAEEKAVKKVSAQVEIKGFRGEDAKDKKATMETYWVPGVNYLGTHGRWAFAELTDMYRIQDDFAAVVQRHVDRAAYGIAAAAPATK